MSTAPVGQGNHARVSDPSTWPEHVRARYGVRSRRRRAAVVTALALVILITPLAAQRAWRASSQQGVLSMPAFRIAGPARVDLDLRYVAKQETFTCAVRAQDANRVDVGFAYLVLKPGSSRSWTYPLNTRAAAAAADVLGCAPGVGTSRLPTPQFAPGVKPPVQPAPGIAPRANGGFATVRP